MMPMQKHLKHLLCLLLVFITALSAMPICYADGLFSKSVGDTRDYYESIAGWDLDKIDAVEWQDTIPVYDITIDDKGKKHKGEQIGEKEYTYDREVGYEYEHYREAHEIMCEELGIEPYDAEPMFGGSGAGIVRVALGQVGNSGNEYMAWHGIQGSWCCMFVTWCAQQCGLIEAGIFIKTAWCPDLYNHFKSQGFAEYLPRDTQQLGSGSYSICPGDIVFWDDTGNLFPAAGVPITARLHVEIVTAVGEGYIESTGKQGDNVGTRQIPRGTGEAIRIIHVEYPSVAETSYGNVSPREAEDCTYEYLTQYMGFSHAVACGIMGNIKRECSFDYTLKASDVAEGGGLCQWTNLWFRFTDVCSCSYDEFCSSFDTQLWFLNYTLTQPCAATMTAFYTPNRAGCTTRYGNEHVYDVLMDLSAKGNSESVVREATKEFCWRYEKPGDGPVEYGQRESYAIEYYNRYK